MLIEMPNRPSEFAGRKSAKADPFPADVEMIISAMEAGRYAWTQQLEENAPDRSAREDQRTGERLLYRVRAELRLFSDQAGSPAWLIYVRDADPRGIGFISEHRLPLGYGGFVELVAPSGRPLSIPGTLLRCREATPGWYEGAMSFNREQREFKI